MTQAPSISAALLERTLRAIYCNRFDRLDCGELAFAGAWIALLHDDEPMADGFNREAALTAIRGELAKRIRKECFQ